MGQGTGRSGRGKTGMTFASMIRKHEPRRVPEVKIATSAIVTSLAAEGYDTVAAPFGNAQVDLARTDARIVGLSADLAKYTDLHVFASAMPDRFYQISLAEQVLVSAAGLAREGFIPLPPPTRSLPAAAPMTLSPWRSPRKACRSRLSAPSRA